MRILGVDPGQSIGLCLYDADQRRVLEASTVKQVADVVYDLWTCDVIVVERLVPHGASYPQVVTASFIAGRLLERAAAHMGVLHAVELTRHEVRRELQDATHGSVRVKDDPSVWAALVLLHGGQEAARKPRKRKGVIVDDGGAIGLPVAHERAALAVAVAYALKRERAIERGTSDEEPNGSA